MEIIETRGAFRLTVSPDPEAENPRNFDSSVVHVVTVPHSRYVNVDGNGGPLRAWWDDLSGSDDRAREFANAALISHGASAVVHTPQHGPVSVWYLMPGEAGTSDPEALIRAEISTYQAWADGETYRWAIERCTDWVRADSSEGTVSTWEEVESCGGYYGLEDVRSAGLAVLTEACREGN